MRKRESLYVQFSLVSHSLNTRNRDYELQKHGSAKRKSVYARVK